MKFSTQFNEPAENLKAEMASAAKEGIPLKREELERRLPVADADNAAVEYMSAAALYAKLKPAHGALEEFSDGRPSPEHRAQALRELEAFRPVLALVEKGAAKKDCVFPSGTAMASGASLIELMSALEGGVVRGAVLLAPDATDGLARAARHGDRAGHLMRGGSPSLVMSGVKSLIGIEGAICDVAKANSDNPSVLAKAGQTLAQLPTLPDYRYSFGVEIVQQMELFAAASECRGPLSEDKLKRQTFDMLCEMVKGNVPPVVLGLQSRFIHGARQAWKALPEGGRDYVKCEEALLLPLKAENDDSSTVAELYGQYMRMQDVWERIIGNEHVFRRELAERRVAHAYLWVLSERVRGGKWPSGLDPKDPDRVDPYSGEALKYERTEKGVRIYSLGPSGKGAGAPEKDLVLAQYP